MRVAYLMNTYPMTSTTFIPREIHALERQGVEVRRFAVRRWDTELVDAGDLDEQAKTEYLLSGAALRLVTAFFVECATNSAGVFRALGPWMRLIGNARGGLLRHTAYLMQAALFRQRARGEDIDHVHAHFGANATAVAMLAKLMGGPDYSFTVHGPDELRASPLLSYPEKIQHAKFVAAISHFCRSQLILFSDGRFGDKIKIVHCGLDLDRFEASAPPENHELLCVGRLCPQKGQTMLPSAVAALRSEFPDIRIHLIGDGESRGAIEAEIDRLGLDGAVVLHGWREGEFVRTMMKETAVFVLPSAAEGLPVVIMEALALGRPVISTYIAGIPELVDDECGWLVPAGSEADLAAAMRAALEAGPDTRAALGAAGRARVEARHDVDREAAKLRRLFAANDSVN